MLTNCEYTKARDMLLERVCPVGTERASISACVGRVLAQDILAAFDVPPFDRSPYDGYAFRAADTAGASKDSPVTLRVTQEIPAGCAKPEPVVAGEAAKILTGAPIPPGADAVCQFERTEFTENSVTLFSAYCAGENLIRRGEDVQAGQLLAKAGTVIDGPMAGTLAAQNAAPMLVYRRPRAGIVTTGSELRGTGVTLGPGQIVNSNRYAFEAELARQGLKAQFYGAPRDCTEEIAAALEAALERSDVVVVTGGVSVGDYDLTPAAIEAIGAEILVQNVDLKPGGKCCYALRGGKLICGLSGNPASALTNFCAVALPAVRKLRGLAEPRLRELTVTLARPFSKKSPRTRLLRGKLDFDGGRAVILAPEAQGNGVLHTMSGCDLLAHIPAGSGPLPAGTELQAFLLPSGL